MTLYPDLVPEEARPAFRRAACDLLVLRNLVELLGARAALDGGQVAALAEERARASSAVALLLREYCHRVLTLEQVTEALEATTNPVAVMDRVRAQWAAR